MIKRILFILISVLTICSCEMTPQQGKVVFVSIAVDYNAPDGINALDNPPEDQRVLSSQIEALSYASGEIYEQYLFLEKNGIRYFNGTEKKWNHDDILYTLSELDTLQSDLVILHYSGHGDSTGALVTDADTSSRLSAERLLDAMRGIDGRKCLFLDSCFSGVFIDDAGYMHNGDRFEDGNLESDNILNAFIPSFIGTFYKKDYGNDNIWIIAAATEEQNSFDNWDSGLPQQEKFGAFSYYLALALGYDMENDTPLLPPKGTRMTFYSLWEEIRKSMADDLKREATPQVTLSVTDPVLFSL